MTSLGTASPLLDQNCGAPAPAIMESGTAPALESYRGTWWVLHTRARNEKTVAEILARQGVSYFLPLVHYRRRYAGRLRNVQIPLFPGYVFLCGGLAERQLALRTNRVAHVLDVPDQERLRHDLLQVARVVLSDDAVDLCPRLMVGARCRVISGSLKGVEGVVIRRRGPWRVYVGVDFLGQSAELEIESTLLEVLDEDS